MRCCKFRAEFTRQEAFLQASIPPKCIRTFSLSREQERLLLSFKVTVADVSLFDALGSKTLLELLVL